MNQDNLTELARKYVQDTVPEHDLTVDEANLTKALFAYRETHKNRLSETLLTDDRLLAEWLAYLHIYPDEDMDPAEADDIMVTCLFDFFYKSTLDGAAYNILQEMPKTSLVKDPEDKETLEYVYKHFDYDRYATEVLDTTVYKETPFGVLVKPQ